MDLGQIVDSLVFEQAGRSFAINENNCWLQPGFEVVAELGRAQL